jgi:hypothetical protein
MGLQKKVVHVEYIAVKFCLQQPGQRGFSGSAAALNGNQNRFPLR